MLPVLDGGLVDDPAAIAVLTEADESPNLFGFGDCRFSLGNADFWCAAIALNLDDGYDISELVDILRSHPAHSTTEGSLAVFSIAVNELVENATILCLESSHLRLNLSDFSNNRIKVLLLHIQRLLMQLSNAN
jgi:hypothetical protein